MELFQSLKLRIKLFPVKMLFLEIPETELYDERDGIFYTIKPIVLRLEHSLVSVSKWETKWKKPFLSKSIQKTLEESRDYVRCMTLNQNVDDKVYYALTAEHFKQINDYIEDNRTATWFNERNHGSASREVITSELIYYQMVAYRIPFECQKWHLSRLLTLIRICNIKNSPGKNIPKNEIMARNQSLNAARRKAMHTKG